MFRVYSLIKKLLNPDRTKNSLLSRIEKNVLALDPEIFAAAELVANVAPVAGMREPSLTKSYTHSHKASCVLSTIKINLFNHSSRPSHVSDAPANECYNPILAHFFNKIQDPHSHQSSSSSFLLILLTSEKFIRINNITVALSKKRKKKKK